MSYHGDIRLGDTIDVKFTTVNTSGVPTTLAGTPVISAYVGNGTTEITAGITLTVDFDARTGLHNVRIVASSGNGFATATNVSLVITTGTVGGSSVVGYEIGSFSIENRSAVMPTTAARTLDVSAGGEAGVDWANIGSPTTAQNLSATNIDVDQVVASVSGAVGSVTGAVGSVAAGGITATSIATGAVDADALAADAVTEIRSLVSGTSDSGTTTTMVDAARTEADTDYWKGAFILFTSGVISGQVRLITAFDAALDQITFAPATTQAVSTQTYEILPAARMDLQLWLGSVVSALISGRVDANTQAMAANVITSSIIATDAIGAAQVAANAIGASELAADAVAEIADGVWDEDATGHQTQGTFGQAIGDPVADADTIWGLANTNLDAAMSSRASAAALSTAQTDISAILVDTGTTLDGRIPAALVGGRIDASVGAIAANAITAAAIADGAIDRATLAADTGLQSIRSSTAQAGAAGTITLDASASAVDDFYNDTLIVLTGGTGVGQVRRIRDYVGATRVATIIPVWTTNPDVTSTFAILPLASVWDETLADHLDSGSTGNALNAAGAAGDPWSTALPGAYGAGTAGNIVGNNLNATISSRSSHSAADVWTAGTRTLTAATNITSTGGTTVPQTGDSFARLGAPAGASIAADLVAIEAQTDDIGAAGAGLTAVPWNAAWDAEVQSEVDDALVVQRLDELLNADSDIDGAAPPTVGSVMHELLTKTAASFTYDQSTDSLEAVRDNMGTAQTGDSFARIGAPAGASVSADVAAVKVDTAAILVDTGTTLDGRIPAALVGGRMDSSIGAVASGVIAAASFAANALDAVWSTATRLLTAGTNIALAKGTGVTGFNDLSAAQVNAEVVDALATDTYAEPGQGAPAATATLAAKINYLYKSWRNRKTQTATTRRLFADDGTTVDQLATDSDDATTFVKGEMGTGP